MTPLDPAALEGSSPDATLARRLALAGYAALFAAGFADNARGPILPSIVETFQVPDALAGTIFSVACLSGLPGGLAAGALVARAGPRATLRVTALLGAVGLAILGVAGALGREAFALVPVAAALLGAGLSGLGIVANVYVSIAVAPGERPRALARLHVLYAVASLLVPFVIAEATSRVPWPLVVGAVALVPGALLPLSVRVPLVPPARARSSAGAASRPPPELRRSGLAIARSTLAVSLFVVGEVAVSGWLTLFVERTSDAPRLERAALLSGFFLGMGLARSAGGVFLREDRVGRAVLLGALGSAASVLAGLHVHPAFLSLEGATVGVLFPAAVGALTLELPEELHGRALGIVCAGYSTALAAAHALIGRVSDLYGIRAALHVSPACLLLGALVFALGPRRPRVSVGDSDDSCRGRG